jgi:hypothetical protein
MIRSALGEDGPTHQPVEHLAAFDVALFLWSAGTCPRFPLFSLDFRRPIGSGAARN